MKARLKAQNKASPQHQGAADPGRPVVQPQNHRVPAVGSLGRGVVVAGHSGSSCGNFGEHRQAEEQTSPDQPGVQFCWLVVVLVKALAQVSRPVKGWTRFPDHRSFAGCSPGSPRSKKLHAVQWRVRGHHDLGRLHQPHVCKAASDGVRVRRCPSARSRLGRSCQEAVFELVMILAGAARVPGVGNAAIPPFVQALASTTNVGLT